MTEREGRERETDREQTHGHKHRDTARLIAIQVEIHIERQYRILLEHHALHLLSYINILVVTWVSAITQ